MPTNKEPGISHCKRCNNKAFNSISDLRRHQWAAHAEIFNKAIKGRKWTAEQRRKFKEALRLKKTNGQFLVKANTRQKNLSAIDLLKQLHIQRTFMNDVVQLVEGIISRS